MNIYETAHYFHVMNRGANTKGIFLTQGQARLFLALALQFSRRYHVWIVAYCLMHNHFHFVIYANRRSKVRFMQSLQGTYAQAFNAKLKRSGPLFQGRYTWRFIETERYLKKVVDYVHENPKSCGYEQNLEKYPWSSLGNKNFPGLTAKANRSPLQS